MLYEVSLLCVCVCDAISCGSRGFGRDVWEACPRRSNTMNNSKLGLALSEGVCLLAISANVCHIRLGS